jgi:IS30 family transposase
VTALLPLKGGIHMLTYDNSKEFSLHELTHEVLGSTAYYAHP